VKTFLAIFAVVLLPTLLFFRFHTESGLTELERCKTAVGQAKSWSIESISQPQSPNYVAITNRSKVSCPDDYVYFYRSRTPDNVIGEQATIHTNGETYIENVDGKWEKSAATNDSPASKECGKGPLLVQQTVLNAIIELPRRRAGKIVKGKLQSDNAGSCQDWSIDYGNEWPQMAPYTICLDLKTHLPRRITFSESDATNDFSGWNSTKIEPPAL
jgi:hypothetical protein